MSNDISSSSLVSNGFQHTNTYTSFDLMSSTVSYTILFHSKIMPTMSGKKESQFVISVQIHWLLNTFHIESTTCNERAIFLFVKTIVWKIQMEYTRLRRKICAKLQSSFSIFFCSGRSGSQGHILYAKYDSKFIWFRTWPLFQLQSLLHVR